MDIFLLADWTDLPWQNWGLAGAVISSLLAYIYILRRDVMGLASRVVKMAEDNAARLERLSGEYAENIKENTKATAIQTEVTRALNDYLRQLNGKDK